MTHLFFYYVAVSGLLPRLVTPLFEASIARTPVVVVEGGRAVGKSTACDLLIQRRGWAPRVDLADPDTAALLRLDPERFLTEAPSPCVLDEAQLEPLLPLWIKRIVDRRRRPGQFVLTGSARLGRHQLGGTDPLAGRSVRLTMWSMTQSELDGRTSDVVDRAFGDGWVANDPVPAARPSPWLGGLPAVSGVRASAPAWQWEREIAAYVEAALPLAVAGTRADVGRLLRTFRYFAANSGQLANMARAANDLGVQAATVRNHLELLEAGFLLFRADAERPTEQRVIASHPRIYPTDAAFATWAMRAWTGQVSAASIGSLTETVVAHDLAALASAHPERILVRHWRDDRNQEEVDLLLVHPDGRYVPVEVKAATSVGPRDASGLRAFAAHAGDACVRGVLIYEGRGVVDLTERGTYPPIVAIPRSML